MAPEITAAYIASAVALMAGTFSFAQFLINRRDQRNVEINKNLFDALKWFEGGTQKRSIGIAVIEASWNDSKREYLKKVWKPLLVNQVIHILKHSDRQDSKTEYSNLIRIFNLLRSTKLTGDEQTDIHGCLKSANYFQSGSGVKKQNAETGIYLIEADKDQWAKVFQVNPEVEKS